MPARKQEVAVQEPGQRPIALNDELNTKLMDAFMAIPDGEGGGMEAILEALIEADSIDDLNAPWDADKWDSLLSAEIKVTEVIRRESTYTEGLPFYLVVRGIDMRNSKAITFTTSAASAVLQLVVAHDKGWIPGLVVKPVTADKPTKDGYYPKHFNVIAKNA